MQRIALICSLLGALLLSATPVCARNGAWYVGGDFGGMIVDDVNITLTTPPPTVPSSSTLQLNHDYGYDGSLFVGYDLGQFRLEAEVGYKRAAVDDIESSIAPPPLIISVPFQGDGSTSSLSFMVNGMLDFGDDDGLSGFVGGGVGVARVDYNGVRAFSNQAAIVDGADDTFAWQLMAGLRYPVSDDVDVMLMYRHFETQDIRVDTFTGRDADVGFGSNSILIGFTYDFSAPFGPR